MVKTSIWDDDYIGELSPHGKLCFVALVTNRNSTIIGFFPVTVKNLYDDTGIPKDEIRELLAKFEADGKLIYRDGFALLINFIRHQTLNPQILKGIHNTFEELPEWAKNSLAIAYPEHFGGYREPIGSDPANLKSLSSNTQSLTSKAKEEKEEDVFLDPAVQAYNDAKDLRTAICLAQGKKPKVSMITFEEWQLITAAFEHWREVFGKNAGARLNVQRGRVVLDRLRPPVQYTLDDIKKAIEGCKLSPYHNGSNGESGSTVYDDLELICRDDAHLERFMGYYDAYGNGKGNGNSKPGTGSRGSAVERVDEIVRDAQRFERPTID